MASKRIAQVNELIRQELGSIFLRELELPNNCIVTISKVETSADLEHAKVWLKIYPTDFTDSVLGLITKRVKAIRSILSQKIILRIMPELKFMIDPSEEKASRIDELIEKIHEENG